MAEVSVLVADTQRLFAEAVSVALATVPGISVLGDVALSGPSALEEAAWLQPDVVLLDYWIVGDLAATTVTTEIGRRSPASKVLILSWVFGADHVEKSLAAGAVGFLPKSLAVTQVAEAVFRAHVGEVPVFADELQRLVGTIERRGEESVQRWQRLSSLSPREAKILALLAEGRPVKQLAADLFVNAGTLRNHIHSILDKTGTHSQEEAIKLARLEGFLPTTPTARPSDTEGVPRD